METSKIDVKSLRHPERSRGSSAVRDAQRLRFLDDARKDKVVLYGKFMLTFKNASLRRGAHLLLENINLSIQPGQKVGLIGKNGSGKSSLFALIRNQLSLDSGECLLANNILVAHLAQETPALEVPALDYVMEGDVELQVILKKLAVAEEAQDGMAIAKCHGDLQTIDGYSACARAAKLLLGLGVETLKQQNPVASFSGGWRMRLNLAKALMSRSDLLLLDEPTNHLDLDAIFWLEKYLQGYQGTLLLISHDREFLDAVTTHIAHLEHRNIVLYTGNYSTFEKERAQKFTLQQAMFEKQQKQRAHMQKFIDKFRYKASKARQAQSRIKALEKMELIAAANIDSEFQFTFKESKQNTNPLVSFDNVATGYNDVVVLENININIEAKARLGIVGPNGAGKSTFIKLIADILHPFKGIITRAKTLKFGYFAQHQIDHLYINESPLQHLKRIAVDASEQKIRNFLGTFNFSGNKIFESIETFSGGEKARLALAMIVWHEPNVLLLDEPTNHFDLDMRYALTMALQDFSGAILIVSHDRHLLRTTTDELLLVYDKNVAYFTGDIDDYHKFIDKEFKSQKQLSQKVKTKTPKQALSQRSKSELQKKVKQIEKQIDKLQKELAEVDDSLSSKMIYQTENKSKLKETLQAQAKLKKDIAELENKWVMISQEL